MPLFRLTQSAMMAGMGDEVVLLDSVNGHYYSLDRVGRSMLDLALGEDEQDRVLALLESRFDAGPAQLAADFSALMDSLVAAGLVEPTSPSAG